jgi:hypothetical protein
MTNLSDTQIILSAVGNALASGVQPQALLSAISQSFDPWEIDAAVSAAIRLSEIQEEHRNGNPYQRHEVSS